MTKTYSSKHAENKNSRYCRGREAQQFNKDLDIRDRDDKRCATVGPRYTFG